MTKQDKIIFYLKQLELSYIEARLYVALLENGPITIRELAKLINIKRTTAYFYVDQLAEKGLVVRLTNDPTRLVCAEQVAEKIQKLINKKLEVAKKIKANFPEILSIINKSTSSAHFANNYEFKSYKGKDSTKYVFNDIIQAKEIRSFANISEFISIFPDSFHVIDEVIRKDKKIRFFEILEDTPQATLAVNESLNAADGRYLCKYFPDGMNFRSSDITIYEGKVSIINMRENINATIIQNQNIYNCFKELFDFMWTNLPNQAQQYPHVL